jgi:hypothetical protein
MVSAPFLGGRGADAASFGEGGSFTLGLLGLLMKMRESFSVMERQRNVGRIVDIPAEQVVEPPEIMRMREALARGELHNPDASLPLLHRPVSLEIIERHRRKAASAKKMV